MSVPKGYNKAGHRWDQYTRTEVTVWYNRSGGGVDEPRFILEINGKQSEPLSLGEIQTLQDCLRNDLDLNKPALFV